MLKRLMILLKYSGKMLCFTSASTDYRQFFLFLCNKVSVLRKWRVHIPIITSVCAHLVMGPKQQEKNCGRSVVKINGQQKFDSMEVLSSQSGTHVTKLPRTPRCCVQYLHTSALTTWSFVQISPGVFTTFVASIINSKIKVKPIFMYRRRAQAYMQHIKLPFKAII
jgi:hypothetical protein